MPASVAGASAGMGRCVLGQVSHLQELSYVGPHAPVAWVLARIGLGVSKCFIDILYGLHLVRLGYDLPTRPAAPLLYACGGYWTVW